MQISEQEVDLLNLIENLEYNDELDDMVIASKTLLRNELEEEDEVEEVVEVEQVEYYYCETHHVHTQYLE